MKSSMRTVFPFVRAGCGSWYSTVTRGEIAVPRRVARGPTDILEVLSGVVGRDSTAAHFKYHDDPYLIPYSNPSKRSYALSQEAGRKAAQWVRQQHSDLFQHRIAEPFPVKAVYNEESDATEHTLLDLVHTQQVSDVLTVLKVMKKRGQSLSVETKQKVLELLCYYNCEDPLSSEWVEENWFRQGNSARAGRNLWKDDGLAERLFEDIVSSGGDKSAAQCALIAGMMSHGQVDRGWKLFEESKAEGVRMPVQVYNAVLRKATHLREAHDMIWHLVLDLLREMNHVGVRPDLGTLNSVLFSLELIASNRNTKANALSVLVEFKQLGVEPSLASFAHLVRIYQRDRARLPGALRYMIETLERCKTAKAQTKEDGLFFSRAMEAIAVTVGDPDLATRLDQLLHSTANYNLVGSAFHESLYYRHYFLLLMRTTELDDFMALYKQLVPNVYVPELLVMAELLATVEAQMGWAHLAQLWSDLVLFDQLRANSVGKLLSVAVQAAQHDPALGPEMSAIGWAAFEKLQSESARNVEWTGEMLGDVLAVLVAGKEMSKAHIVMDSLHRLQNTTTGDPSSESLSAYVAACLLLNNPSGALRCLRYCDSRQLPLTDSLANTIRTSGIHLDDSQIELLSKIEKQS